MIDHRAGVGLSDSAALTPNLPPMAGRGLFEAPTYTCSHCMFVVVLHPLRNRDRAYCKKCDHYVCDKCGVVKAQTGVCRTMNQVIEELQEHAARAEQSGSIILTT